MRRSIVTLWLLFWSISTLPAQLHPAHERCNTHHHENVQKFQGWLQNLAQFRASTEKELYRIPIVIHVHHFGEPIGEGTNLSDEVIQSQVAIINQDFRRMAGTRGFNEHPAGGDSRIEFVLAQRDPEGNPTNGIVRMDLSKEPLPPGLGNMLLLSAHFSMWNPEHYLNIWSFPWLPEMTSLGFARFPESHLPGLPNESQEGWAIPGIGQVDGVAVNAHHFGETGKTGPYSLGRTLTHEIGHFLGLYHVWGPNDHDRDGCELDDFCEDTPPTRSMISGCPTNAIACDGRPAMVENYMDYADDACMNIFTQDQIRRMRTVLENSPRRKTLLNSPALIPILETPDNLAKTVSVYPNPVAERLIISFENHMLENVTITLHDTNGKQVLNKSYPFVFREQIEVLIPKSEEKMLLLTLKAEGQSHREKLLIK